MKLTKDQVKKVAKLANLPLTNDEEELYSQQLSEVLSYMDQLNQVDTKAIEPTFNVTGLINVTQEDVTKESLSQEEALKNISKKKDNFFVTKGVFEDE